MPNYTVAHSPDADDIFMYYAISFGWINTDDIKFSNIALDIETLNQEALKNNYDITAISFGLYPKIKNEYSLLRTATSFGQGYGPKLIKKKSTILKRNFKVALSGEHTTNGLIFKLKYPQARITYMNFLDIEDAVLNGNVDAGVLIHESILTFSDKLEVEAEIWDIWLDLIKDELPLPLGGMAIRRSLPLVRAISCEEILTRAVDVGVKNANLLGNMLIERDLVRVDKQKLDKYLSLYANNDSITLSQKHIQAIDKLFELGYNNSFFPDLIKTQDYLIPKEYKELRYS